MKADEIFNDIYSKLCVYHEQNQFYVLKKKNIGKKNLKRLKKTLEIEKINFMENERKLVCWLNERKLKSAREVYTPDTIKKLEEEERRLQKQFYDDFFEGIENMREAN